VLALRRRQLPRAGRADAGALVEALGRLAVRRPEAVLVDVGTGRLSAHRLLDEAGDLLVGGVRGGDGERVVHRERALERVQRDRRLLGLALVVLPQPLLGRQRDRLLAAGVLAERLELRLDRGDGALPDGPDDAGEDRVAVGVVRQQRAGHHQRAHARRVAHRVGHDQPDRSGRDHLVLGHRAARRAPGGLEQVVPGRAGGDALPLQLHRERLRRAHHDRARRHRGLRGDDAVVALLALLAFAVGLRQGDPQGRVGDPHVGALVRGVRHALPGQQRRHRRRLDLLHVGPDALAVHFVGAVVEALGGLLHDRRDVGRSRDRQLHRVVAGAAAALRERVHADAQQQRQAHGAGHRPDQRGRAALALARAAPPVLVTAGVAARAARAAGAPRSAAVAAGVTGAVRPAEVAGRRAAVGAAYGVVLAVTGSGEG